MSPRSDRKSTRLNSSHTEIYTLSLHDALPISDGVDEVLRAQQQRELAEVHLGDEDLVVAPEDVAEVRSEEHTSELQSHRDLHSFPTRRSSDLRWRRRGTSRAAAARAGRGSSRGRGPCRSARGCRRG